MSRITNTIKCSVICLCILVMGCSTPEYIKRNRLLVMEGNIETAVENYRSLLQKDPQNAEIRYELSRALYEGGDYESAVREIQKAILLEPQVDDYRLLAGKLHYEVGDYFNATNHLLNLLLLNSQSLEGYLYLGKVYNKTGKKDEALKKLETGISIEPAYFELRYQWCSIRFQQLTSRSDRIRLDELTGDGKGSSPVDRKTAVEDDIRALLVRTKEALRLKPHSIKGNILLSRIHQSLGEINKARRVLISLAESEKPDDRIFYNLALLDYTIGNLNRALESVHQMEERSLESKILEIRIELQLNPENRLGQEIDRLIADNADIAELHCLQARFFMESDNYAKAERSVQECIQLNPENAMAHFLLFVILDGQSDEYGARLSLKKAFKLAPFDTAIRKEYIRTLLSQGRISEAESLLEHPSLNDTDPDVLYFKGIIQRKRENYKEARSFFESASKHAFLPNIEAAYANLLIDQRYYEKAEDRIDKAETHFPQNLDLAVAKAYLYLKTGDLHNIEPLLKPHLQERSGKGKIHLILAETRADLGKLAASLDILSEGLDLWPGNIELIQMYTLFLGLAEQYSPAIALLEKAQTYQHEYNRLFDLRLKEYYFRVKRMTQFKEKIIYKIR